MSRQLPFVVPQANDLEKVMEFPIKVGEGLDDQEAIARYFNFTARQSSYYREAAESLGLVEIWNNRYFLTEEGARYVALNERSRRQFVGKRLLEIPVVQLVIEELRSSGSLSLEDLARLLRRESHLSGTTPRRRAQSLLAWLRHVESLTGVVKVGVDEVRLAVR